MDNNEEYNDQLSRLQDEIMRILQESFRTETTFRPEPTFREQPDNFNILRDIVTGYNANIREYQSNMTTILELFRLHPNNHTPFDNYDNSQRSNRRSNDNARQTTNDANNLLFSYYVYPARTTGRRTNINNLFQDLQQNVIVRPTQQQITDATQMITYSENENVNPGCPITLEEFQTGDIIQQIRHCRHGFRPGAIQNWFSSNVRCPVCRYDIRHYTAQDTSSNDY